MSHITFVLLVAVGVILGTTVGQDQQDCGPNEEWTNCASACPESCVQDPNQPCTLQCIQGCQCIQGYVKNSAGSCVAPQDCP